ncbi:glycosyltransferase family 4 protein [Aureisphaera sp. CAU 1614]|uniref:Glycosyltransferase family 4 protein n=1 Tax=Halomarinibacterium sedimenti TaxID=2857106 RepID=A0A9X1JV83_9FLAO|nr:glycosyltransferase family 4 protein [Halomarinibacterium sedimenti]MBW2937699.1 glycosyltransferase family 4 protein [Halomarinibacterium sedimenti]
MKKKIVYIGNQLSQSNKGTLTTLDTLSSHLGTEGFEVVTASSKQNKIIRLWQMLQTVFIHRKETSNVLIDTYSTQNFWYAVAVANLCRFLRIPYIPILHGGNLPKRLKRTPNQSKKLFNVAKANVTPSNYLLQTFLRAGFSNTVCIPNTIEINKYPFKSRVGVLPKLLWVRSFAEIYNPFLAIQIIERISKLYPIATLCMVGPDKDGSLQKCKEFAEGKKLPVRFMGKLSKEEWISLSSEYDIFINTTNFDNTPVSVIEAMALGLPIISTNVGGIPFLLENRKDALLVPTNNKEAFIEAIVYLCNNDSLSKTLVKNARKKVEGYDWEIVKHLWIKLLNE